MPSERRNMKNATPFDKLRLLLVGKYKTGKSRVASTARKPILFVDADLRAESVAGKDGVYAISPADFGYPNKPPVGYGEILDILSDLEHEKTLAMMGFEDAPEERVKTLVFDSAQTISQLCIHHALYTSPELRRDIVIAAAKTGQSGTTIHMPNGWDGWMADMEMMNQLVMRALGIPDTDFIMTIHEDDESGKIEVYPTRHRHLMKNFNEVWRVSRPNQLPVAQLIPNYNFTAATNLNATGDITNPDITQLIEEYIANPTGPVQSQSQMNPQQQQPNKNRIATQPLKGIGA